MHLIGSHGLLYVQVPQVVFTLIFTYNGWDFISLTPAFRFRRLRDVGIETTIENLSHSIKSAGWRSTLYLCRLSHFGI